MKVKPSSRGFQVAGQYSMCWVDVQSLLQQKKAPTHQVILSLGSVWACSRTLIVCLSPSTLQALTALLALLSSTFEGPGLNLTMLKVPLFSYKYCDFFSCAGMTVRKKVV